MIFFLILITIVSIAISVKYSHNIRVKYLRECQRREQAEVSCLQQKSNQEQLQYELQDIRAILTSKEEELGDKNQIIQQKNIKLQEFEACHGQLLKLEDKIKEISQVIQEKQQERNELQQEIESLYHCHDSLHTQSKIVAENETLKKERQTFMQSKELLSKQLSQAQSQLSKCQQDFDRLSTALQRFQIVSACHGHSASLFHARIDTDFKCVIDAVEFAKIMFGDILEIWETAYNSAQASDFKNPSNVYLSLQKLAWFGRFYVENNGSIGMDMHKFLKENYNLDSSGESTKVQNNDKLSRLRMFRDGQRMQKMFDHLKISKGTGTNSTLRIYFNLNLESGMIEIGYCGKHLKT